MKPKNELEMIQALTNSVITRAYGDITTAALRGQLNETDIKNIETKVLALLDIPEGLADEFKTFQAELAFSKSKQIILNLFNITRSTRTSEASNER